MSHTQAHQKSTVVGYLITLVVVATILASLASCSTRSIAHTPSKREIRKAMSYSTWEYAQPAVSMPAHSVSPFKHAVIVLDK
jgi:hypothetical protein